MCNFKRNISLQEPINVELSSQVMYYTQTLVILKKFKFNFTVSSFLCHLNDKQSIMLAFTYIILIHIGFNQKF